MRKKQAPPIFVVLLATILTIFNSCSEESDKNQELSNNNSITLKTVTKSNSSKLSDDFNFSFNLNDEYPKNVYGTMDMDNQPVNVNIDISDGLNVSNFQKISNNEIQIESNGELLNY